jgi:hypothetical protein
MQEIKIRTKLGTEYGRAARTAASAVPGDPDRLSLVGWYDKRRRTGGPLEVCGGESARCANSYARSHGARYTVATDNFTFYYASVPEDVVELDPQMVAEVHRGLDRDRFENQQGG